MRCRICQDDVVRIFRTKVLTRHDVDVFHCKSCGFVQTEEPYWLSEAYEEPINREDTGIVARNLRMAEITSLVILTSYARNARFLDYAGGSGLLVRLMRDRGFDFHWHDMYAKNLFARGFESNHDRRDYELVSCFEAMEHFPDPIMEMERMLVFSRNILFSTELIQDTPPIEDQWWYYGFGHGQHVSFYSRRSLENIAHRFGLNFFSDGKNMHLITEKQVGKRIFPILVRLSSLGLDKVTRFFMENRTVRDMAHLSGARKDGR